MRPHLLNPLFAALTSLPGVGPKVEKLYRRLLGRDDAPRILDLLLILPTGVIDRRARPKLRDVVPDTVVTVAVTVDRHRPPPPHRPRAPYQIYTSDETGDLILTYFNARTDYLEKLLPVGETRYVSGTTALYDGMLQMVHPDRVVDEAGLAKLPLIEPVYPLTEGLGLNQVRKAVEAALAAPAGPAGMAGRRAGSRARRFPTFADALRTLASPGRAGRRRCRKASPGRGSPMTSCSPASLRWRWCARICAGPPGRATAGDGHLRKKLIEALPYSLTASQTQRGRRHRRRSRQARAHAAAAAGRRRLGQDRGRAARRRRRHRSAAARPP